jgi:hypothetical protein
MAQERATIAFAEDTKRMRICLSLLGDDGKRKPIWVSFTSANYAGKPRERIARFEGRGQDAAAIKEDQIAWDTRIKELQDTNLRGLSKSAYEVWKCHFGPIIVDPSSEKHNRKRRERAQGKRGTSKKPRMTSDSPVLSTEAIDTTNLTDEQIVKMFYSYEQNVEANNLHRMSKLLQDKYGSSTAIPVTTLAQMRTDAKTYAIETPELIWGDPQFLAWKDRDIKKEEESSDDKVRVIKPGIAYAELEIKIKKTKELVEAYLKRWGI